MAKSDKPDYVLVYDGEGGVRMAPAGTRVEVPPDTPIRWPAEPETMADLDLESEDEPLAFETATVSAPRRPAYVLPAAGAAVICLVGLGLGIVARPHLSDVTAARPAPMQPAPSQAGQLADAQMKVMVLPPALAAVTPPAKGAGRLEVMSAEQRKAAPVIAAAAAPATPPQFLAVRPPAQVAAAQPAATDVSAVERDDCRGARSYAEAMVCHDPELSRADRRLARAYRAAVRSGVPMGQLRAEQDDWLDIREDAAQRSPRAVAQIYDQRIEELEAMAAAAEPR